jgi:hypothetical protein
MAERTGVIAGVSLGTRRLGLAIGTQRELIEWQMKIFPEIYSKKKVKKIWRVIERAVERYGAEAIGLKVPIPALRSDGLTKCLEEITECAQNIGVPVYAYGIEEVERYFLKLGPMNKSALAEKMAEKYPELKKEYFKLSSSVYYTKVFEAVAAMDLVLEEIL